MTQEKIKRPTGLKLVFAYNVILLLFIVVSISMFGWGIGGGGVIGILFILALYYGLWKMKKDWMYLFIFFVLISTIYYIYSTLFFDMTSIIFAVLNCITIYWLYSNRKIFIEPEKGKNALGTKSEWLRLGLIILGMFAIPISIMMIDFNYILYGILAIPIWIIFVWFFIPKLIGKKK